MSYNMLAQKGFQKDSSKSKNRKIKLGNENEFVSQVSLNTKTNTLDHMLEHSRTKRSIDESKLYFTEYTIKKFFKKLKCNLNNNIETSNAEKECPVKDPEKSTVHEEEQSFQDICFNEERHVEKQLNNFKEHEICSLNIRKTKTEGKTIKENGFKRKMQHYKKEHFVNAEMISSSADKLLGKMSKTKNDILEMIESDTKLDFKKIIPSQSEINFSELSSNAGCRLDLKHTIPKISKTAIIDQYANIKGTPSGEHIEVKKELLDTINKLGDVIPSKSVQFFNEHSEQIETIIQNISAIFTNASSTKSINHKDPKCKSNFLTYSVLTKGKPSRNIISYQSTSQTQTSGLKPVTSSNNDLLIKYTLPDKAKTDAYTQFKKTVYFPQMLNERKTKPIPFPNTFEKFKPTKATQLDDQSYNKYFNNLETMDSGVQCQSNSVLNKQTTSTKNSHIPVFIEKGILCKMNKNDQDVQCNAGLNADNNAEQDYVLILSKSKFMNIIKLMKKKQTMSNKDDNNPVGIQATPSKADEYVSTREDSLATGEDDIEVLYKNLQPTNLLSDIKLVYQSSSQNNVLLSKSVSKEKNESLLLKESNISAPSNRIHELGNSSNRLSFYNNNKFLNVDGIIYNKDVSFEDFYKQNLIPNVSKQDNISNRHIIIEAETSDELNEGNENLFTKIKRKMGYLKRTKTVKMSKEQNMSKLLSSRNLVQPVRLNKLLRNQIETKRKIGFQDLKENVLHVNKQHEKEASLSKTTESYTRQIRKQDKQNFLQHQNLDNVNVTLETKTELEEFDNDNEKSLKTWDTPKMQKGKRLELEHSINNFDSGSSKSADDLLSELKDDHNSESLEEEELIMLGDKQSYDIIDIEKTELDDTKEINKSAELTRKTARVKLSEPDQHNVSSTSEWSPIIMPVNDETSDTYCSKIFFCFQKKTQKSKKTSLNVLYFSKRSSPLIDSYEFPIEKGTMYLEKASTSTPSNNGENKLHDKITDSIKPIETSFNNEQHTNKEKERRNI